MGKNIAKVSLGEIAEIENSAQNISAQDFGDITVTTGTHPKHGDYIVINTSGSSLLITN